jgi:pimeloyl-ACP methyl ester carboxylesterase
MKLSQSRFIDVRGLRYHVRTWGDPQAPKLFLLHGWMDMSASFQFLVDALREDWCVYAPDWRGFGLSQWDPNGYWFADYLADLDILLRELSPDAPVNIAGHSMGGNALGLYAGVRPDRVARIALLEGFGLPKSSADKAPRRFAQWMDELAAPPALKAYCSLEEVVDRLRKNNPQLTDARARFLAPHWARPDNAGTWTLVADPRHKMVHPTLYRLEEAVACWKLITAPTLWVWGDGEWMRKWFRGGAQPDGAIVKESADDDELNQRRAAIAHLQEERIPESGHMLHFDAPERLAEILERFFIDQA